jgi:hypothetical protein
MENAPSRPWLGVSRQSYGAYLIIPDDYGFCNNAQNIDTNIKVYSVDNGGILFAA